MSKTTFKKRIPHTEVVEAQRRAAGETWTCLADGYHYLYEKFDYSLSKGNAAALFATARMTTRVREALRDLPFTLPETVFELDSNPLVSKIMRRTGVQQRQQVIRRFYIHLNGFFEALDIWKENGREGTRPRPPYRRVRYARVDWVHTRLKKITGGDQDRNDSNAGSTRTGETLVLQTTRGEPQIRVDWPHPEPQSVQLIMEEGRPTLCAQYDSEKQDLPEGLLRERTPRGNRVAGVDLGVACLATAYDGENALVFEGEALQNLRAVQNREERRFEKKMDRKEVGSRRWTKLSKARDRRLKALRDRGDDILHKITTRLVEGLWMRGVSTVAIGDLSGIKESIDYDADTNRRLHRWAFNQLSEKIEYKADRYGMTVSFVEEAYTSQTCPQCGTAGKHHKRGRVFCCSACGLEAHRDVVGAANIRAKAQDPDKWQSGHLKAGRAPATGEESSSPRGSSSGRKTHQLSLFGLTPERDDGHGESNGAAVSTRATLQDEEPSRTSEVETGPLGKRLHVWYDPHMDCVLGEE